MRHLRHQSWMRLGLVSLTLLGLLAAFSQVGGSVKAAASPVSASSLGDNDEDGPNPIVKENRHPGSDLWQGPNAGFQIADDIGCRSKASPGLQAPGPAVRST